MKDGRPSYDLHWKPINYKTRNGILYEHDLKTKLKTLDLYIRSILNKFDPDDEVEVDIQEFNGKQIVNVKILD